MLRARRARIDPTLVAVTSLAAFRLTRLITDDSLTEPLRQQIFNRWPPSIDRAGLRWNGQRLVERARDVAHPAPHPVGRLLDCHWCSGVYCAALVVALVARHSDLPLPALTWAAAAAVVGFLGAVDHALA
jgi:hypothetical protein